jgi:hypothetical protein
MARKYRPGLDPKPRVWHRGYVSQAQRRHFQKTASLAIFRPGMDYHTPPVGNPGSGKTTIKNKMAQLPRRVSGAGSRLRTKRTQRKR